MIDALSTAIQEEMNVSKVSMGSLFPTPTAATFVLMINTMLLLAKLR